MLKNGNKDNCDFSDEIVSYMYDELAAKERGEFETHLADCMVCTDEFAAVANARFSVFEWHKEDFAHLATPEIVIPYEEKRERQTATAAASIGFAESLRRLLSVGSMSPLMAGAAVVTVVFTLAVVGYLVVGGRSSTVSPGKTELANLSTQPEGPSKEILNTRPADTHPGGTLAEVKTDIPESTDDSPSVVTVRSGGKQSRRINKPSAISRQAKSNIYRVKDIPMASKAPKLSNFDEPEDKSLRLTALFDQVDS